MINSKFAIKYFILISGVLLFFSAMAKFVSADGNAAILNEVDPIFFISFRHLFLIAGSLELVVAIVCFFGYDQKTQLLLLASVSTILTIYRLGLQWVHYYKPCHCLGDFSDALHISPEIADSIMKIILMYLFIGSYGILLWISWQRKKHFSASQPSK